MIQLDAETDAALVGTTTAWCAGIAGSLYGVGRNGGVHRLAGVTEGLGMLSFTFATIAVSLPLAGRRHAVSEPDWHQTGTRLAPDWPQTGPRLAQDWPQTGTRLARDWHETGRKRDFASLARWVGARIAPPAPPGPIDPFARARNLAYPSLSSFPLANAAIDGDTWIRQGRYGKGDTAAACGAISAASSGRCGL